jgi:acetyltransferase-like isoleucine patch superfamily enzyme
VSARHAALIARNGDDLVGIAEMMNLARCMTADPRSWRVPVNSWYLRRKGVRLGKYPWIPGRVDLNLAGQSSLSIGECVFIPRTVEVLGNDEGCIEIGDNVRLDSGARLHVANRATLRIGDCTGVGPYNMFNAFDDLEIGRDVMFGPFVNINTADHGMEAGSPMREQEGTYGPVLIGDNCWLGAGSVILKGVTMGNGAVVGAGAVVNCDIPERCIAVGVPARVVGVRD